MLKIKQEELEKWKNLREQGYSYEKIANMYGVHRTTIQRKLTKNRAYFKDREYYKGHYIIAIYTLDNSLIAVVNTPRELNFLFPNTPSQYIYQNCSKYKPDKENHIRINGIKCIYKLIEKELYNDVISNQNQKMSKFDRVLLELGLPPAVKNNKTGYSIVYTNKPIQESKKNI